MDGEQPIITREIFHRKEKEQIERILKALEKKEWNPTTEVGTNAVVHPYRCLELLELLKSEGKVEDKFNNRYHYWRRKNE